MNYRRVSAGDPLQIPAATWNQLVDGLAKTTGSSAAASRSFRNSVTCLVLNTTGADLPQFGVVGLSDPIFLPSDDEDEFLRQIVLTGVLAAGGNFDLKWGLTTAPILSGEIGEVVVQGLCYAKLDTADAETAGPDNDGTVATLTSADCGLARVLWRADGTGAQWAIVCLG